VEAGGVGIFRTLQPRKLLILRIAAIVRNARNA